MKRELVVILLACISLLCFSCKKFSNGDLKTFDPRHMGAFQVIELCDDVNVTLKHCNNQHEAGDIIITTGENLYDKIVTDTSWINVQYSNNSSDSLRLKRLVIKNENDLNFLRPYDYKLEMTVYYDSLYQLLFTTNGIIHTDTLRGYFLNDKSKLWLEIKGGSGDINIKTHCDHLTTKYTQGTACITLAGEVQYSNTFTNWDCHGIIDGKDMEATSSNIDFYGTNTVITKTFNTITGENHNNGRIYYVKYKRTKSTWFPPSEGHPYGHYADSLYKCPQSIKLVGPNIEPYNP